jgi:allantoicase
MLLLTVPQTTNIKHRKLNVSQRSGVFFHYTLVNLIHLLVIAGWDIKGSYFKKDITDEWIYAAVYKSERDPLDSRTLWIDMLGKNLLPESAEQCIHDHEELLQEYLILPWLDGSLTWYHKH